VVSARKLVAAGVTLGLALFCYPARQDGGSRVPAGAAPGGPLPGFVKTTEKVWLVEESESSELYSNGLRVENSLKTRGQTRRFHAIPRSGDRGGTAEWRAVPAGIVFHTSEGHLAPFEERKNRILKLQSQELLFYARRNRSYHFLIDRFGRVYRIVHEQDKADHAGKSVWADSQWIYVNLNSSFLGVCFEAVTQPGAPDPEISPSQMHSGKALVEMLRDRYQIPPGNCVTHAQVSVNPRNTRIGYHTDWAGNFPFRELGLPDNYQQPLASVALFGFDYDLLFVQSTGARLWKGLLLAEEQLQREAALHGTSLASYREKLQKRYFDYH
jgi:hypothetical protein